MRTNAEVAAQVGPKLGTIRRALSSHIRKMTPDSAEHRAASSLLNALRNVEAHPGVPLMRQFLAEDLARAETALTRHHGEQ